MLGASTTKLGALASFCRSCKHGLSSGIPIVKVFELQAKKGPKQLRQIAAEITEQLEQGSSVEDAFEPHRGALPDLFIDLVVVGEQSGHLPEVLGELEDFYTLQRSLRAQFIQQISWPVLQFVMAIFVIAGLIFILGIIAETRGGQPIEPIGMGLSGASGAITFLVVVFGGLAAILFGLNLFLKQSSGRAAFETMLLSIPALGPCLEAMALARYSIALKLTMETGMSILKAVKLSLRATGNAAYRMYTDAMVTELRSGDELYQAMQNTGRFPEEYIETIMVGETSGRLHDVLGRQADHYNEETERRMKGLTQAAGFVVWGMVAIVIIIAIIRIAMIYVNAINQFAG
jgi:type IV pilus assembly protein PilC